MKDVIVVGAGPAGNNVAFRLASQGYDVTVVDRRYHIGDKLCTGIVGRECIQRFPPDSSMVYRDARVARVIAPEGETVDFPRQDVQAHVIDRVAYVSSFANRAQQAGASYLVGYRVTDVSTSGGCATVQVSNGTETRSLVGKVVVLASGFGSELTSQLGLGKVGDYVTGVQGGVLAPDISEIHVYFGQSIAPGFFAWLVPTSGGKAMFGLLSRHRGQTYLQKLLYRLQEEGKITAVIKEPTRWGVPLRPLGRTFGERVLVVGDAAGQVKPTTGGGIYYALLASEAAANSLDTAFRRNDLSASQLSSYEKEWKSLLSHELEIGYSARRLFETLKDCQIDHLMHTISNNGVYKELVESRALSFDWHSGLIMKVMGHPVLSKALTLSNPLLATLASRRQSPPGSYYAHQRSNIG